MPNPVPATPLRLAVLLSGGGRTLENLAEEIRRGQLPGTIVQVVSSHPGAFGLKRAERLELPHCVVDTRDHRGHQNSFSDAITEAVDTSKPDLILLAGFVRKWNFPDRYEHKVLNIHPALLPAFGGKGHYGAAVHRAVIDAGEKFSGCTVHFADQQYDHGPIILQRVIPVLPADTPETLAERVFAEECLAYPEAIRLVAEGRLDVHEGRVTIRQEKADESPG
jgi:phosphoribosylglycinamide formyltransferase-1